MNPLEISITELLSTRTWVWGCRNMGVLATRLIFNNGGNVAGFVDNDPAVQNTTVMSVRVYSPSDFYKELSEDDYILLCCNENNNKSICEQLSKQGINKNVRCIDFHAFDKIQSRWGDFIEREDEARIISKCCNEYDFRQSWFQEIKEALGWKDKRLHRKLWEFVFIAKVLKDNNMLIPGKKGIGFAVGEEPLPSYFASFGVKVLATDLGLSHKTAELWAESGQNACGDISKLWKSHIIEKEEFANLVSYRDVDMNDIPGDIGEYDFCWSSCAIEHVGGLSLSKQFMKNMIKVLKPGGIAVHTTEFNLWSNDDTEEEGYSVVYRKKDFEELREWYDNHGCHMELSFKRGQGSSEMFLPFPPYEEGDERDHLNLMVGRYASTSFGLIIYKGDRHEQC